MKTGFYNINSLTKDDLKNFFTDAVLKSYDTHIDKLDCDISWARQRTTDKTVGEMIEQADPSYHNICIDRNVQHKSEKYGEIGYTIISDKYFLYIFVTLENFKELVNKYNLKER